MGISSRARTIGVSAVATALVAALGACDHHCGLGERDRQTVNSGQAGPAPGGGGAAYQDVPLQGDTSDAEFSLSNVASPSQPGGVDAYLVPTSCDKLFDGPYPGAAPRCTIYVGPARPGEATGHVKLAAGRYRVYLQGFSNVSVPVGYLVDVYIWDYSCRPLLQ